MSFSPTVEQVAAIDAFRTGDNMVLEAVAGSGKTSTLKLMGQASVRRGIYVAFNKSVQLEAEASFPSNVTARTSNSLAYRDTVTEWMKRRMYGKRQTGRDVAKILNIDDSFDFGDANLRPAAFAAIVAGTVKRFCYSADEEIGTQHVPFQEWAADDNTRSNLAEVVLPYARKAWADITKPSGRLKFEHDYYLKIWALGHPQIHTDFILLDEAQDTNPVMVGVLREQRNTQIIAVGDANQAIYGWRGASDAMQAFNPKHHLYLTQSFRFGQDIADEANVWLDMLQAPVRVRGFNEIHSEVCPMDTVDTVLARTNAGAIEQVMEILKQGQLPAFVGGADQIKRFAEAAKQLMDGKKVTHPDLSIFGSWDSVKAYVMSDAGGADLAVNVRLIEAHGPDEVIAATSATVSEDKADVIVSTSHKAKGREWNRVRIHDDFPEPTLKRPLQRADMMLAYVSVTRAKHYLDNAGLAWVHSYSEKEAVA